MPATGDGACERRGHLHGCGRPREYGAPAMDTPDTHPSAPAPPVATTWLPDLLDAVLQRRQLATRVALGAAGVGVLLALLVPGLVAPRPFTGFVVGLVAVLLAVAVVVVADNADVTVRGQRHARAAGGRSLGSLTRGVDGIDPYAPEMAALAAALFVPDERRVVGVTPASRTLLETSDVAESLAVAAASAGRRTMFMDLGDTGARTERGVAEVARGVARFADVVTFDEELSLARVGAGTDPSAAIDALGELLPRLPSDIEALVVALPSDAERGPGTLDVLDEVVVVAERERTRRVDLVRTLGGVSSDVTRSVLLLEPLAGPAEQSEQSALAAAIRGEDDGSTPLLELDLDDSDDEVRVLHESAAPAGPTSAPNTLELRTSPPAPPQRALLVDRPERAGDEIRSLGAIDSLTRRLDREDEPSSH